MHAHQRDIPLCKSITTVCQGQIYTARMVKTRFVNMQAKVTVLCRHINGIYTLYQRFTRKAVFYQVMN